MLQDNTRHEHLIQTIKLNASLKQMHKNLAWEIFNKIHWGFINIPLHMKWKATRNRYRLEHNTQHEGCTACLAALASFTENIEPPTPLPGEQSQEKMSKMRLQGLCWWPWGPLTTPWYLKGKCICPLNNLVHKQKQWFKSVSSGDSVP